ncbi:L,D-transpeptidase family protein [Maritimibacter sp. DP07]|jgi:lipoprotein-anchoring transpeptidase ErfK/SrfK|uniref:L,D-transpeptidase family protein n=1 Tax=Maritimibacter harenae TaxID=2606218 RepID=A0A845M9A7_9RHOB|nr:L,D-transpeptidase family protein [Maritimibacter harenae]MZR13021.1 L,D-transpeptidase family protein [Maritimibacter harenae]
MTRTLTRRGLLAAASALPFVAPAILRAQSAEAEIVGADDETTNTVVRRNASSFRTMDWRDHFETLGKGAIVCDTVSRALHFWNSDASIYKLYPTSVPRTDELTKRGYTEVVRKKVGPTWTPTPSMHERFPDLPDVMPAGPDNPLGTHAMYLAWPAYLIHGTHDTRKIGRRSSDGCIGLYNEKIAELFELTEIGTQVRLV